MEVDFIFKIAAIGIIVAVLYQVLSRSGREEYATLTVIAGSRNSDDAAAGYRGASQHHRINL